MKSELARRAMEDDKITYTASGLMTTCDSTARKVAH